MRNSVGFRGTDEWKLNGENDKRGNIDIMWTDHLCNNMSLKKKDNVRCRDLHIYFGGGGRILSVTDFTRHTIPVTEGRLAD